MKKLQDDILKQEKYSKHKEQFLQGNMLQLHELFQYDYNGFLVQGSLISDLHHDLMGHDEHQFDELIHEHEILLDIGNQQRFLEHHDIVL